jgi:thioredoxin reductase
MKDKVEGRIAMHMSAQIGKVDWDGEKVHVHYDQPEKPNQVFVADHVVAATGYKPKVGALGFLDPDLARQIKTAEDTPVLSPTFQTSVPGLHMIGLASANCFGPAQRFAVGAKFTSKYLAGYLKRQYA